MAMTGAILGDIAGSQFEFRNCTDPEGCTLFTERCRFTDDTVMTLAVKYAIDNGIPFEEAMHEIGRRYPASGYGGKFFDWMFGKDPKPYNSFGNGSAMRISYIADHYSSLSDIKAKAKECAEITHNHPEGIKGAVVTATCIWLARNKSKQEIYDYLLIEYPAGEYEYSIDRSIESLRQTYSWNETCQGSVPVALRCFLESEDYESFLRLVFSLPCDADTLAAIGGGVAEEYYGKTGFDDSALIDRYLDKYLKKIYFE